jgi:hypothetical protein
MRKNKIFLQFQNFFSFRIEFNCKTIEKTNQKVSFSKLFFNEILILKTLFSRLPFFKKIKKQERKKKKHTEK